jgi:hypothetical protein
MQSKWLNNKVFSKNMIQKQKGENGVAMPQ